MVQTAGATPCTLQPWLHVLRKGPQNATIEKNVTEVKLISFNKPTIIGIRTDKPVEDFVCYKLVYGRPQNLLTNSDRQPKQWCSGSKASS